MSELKIATGLIFLFLTSSPMEAGIMSSSFSYQGLLKQSGSPAQGVFDFRFSIFTDQTEGSQVGSSNLRPGVSADRGLFSVVLDFGASIVNQQSLWLQVEVRQTSGPGEYTVLNPRQPLLMFARNGKHPPLSALLTGQVTVGPGSDIVIGTETDFASELSVGDAIGIANVVFTVTEITDDFQLRLSAPHPSGAFGEPAYTDSTLLAIETAAGHPKLTVGREGLRVGGGSPITRIEHGTIGICRDGDATAPSGTEFFPQPFLEPPTLVLTGEVLGGLNCTISILGEVTTDAFSWQGFSTIFGVPTGCDCFHWIAVGKELGEPE